MSFLGELNRRNVIRVGIAYGVFSWPVLQVADVVFPALSLPEWTITLVIVLLAIGALPVLIFSWVYELTPEGVKKESDVDRSQSITQHTARKLDMAVIVLLVLGIGLVAAGQFGLLPGLAPVDETGTAVTDPAPGEGATASESDTEAADATEQDAPADRSIAVLPFLNLSSDPEQEYFSDGLAESLLHMLAQINELQVAARTSSFRFKGQTPEIADVGRQLKVAHVLEGSVRRAGDTVRVTAQLIKVDDGFHLWSGTYDRQMDDIFAIQDEIATHVVDALKVALLGEAEATLSSRDTRDLEAYEAYLRGRQQLAISAHGSLPDAETHFQRALAIDPDYTRAWVSLGQTYLQMGNTGQIPFHEVARRLQPIITSLERLDPNSAAAELMRAWSIWWQVDTARDDAARPIFQRAYERDPEDGFVALYYATFLDWTGDDDQAVAVASRALERDPMSGELHMRLGFAYRGVPDLEAALFHARQLIELEPDNPNGHGLQSVIFASQGRYVDAVLANRKSMRLDPGDYELPADEALFLMALEDFEAAEERIEASLAISPDGFLPQVAEFALRLRQGDHERSSQVLSKIAESGVPPRRWGTGVMAELMLDYGLSTGRHQEVFDRLQDWLGVEATDASPGSGFEPVYKLTLVPLLRQAGNDEVADEIVAEMSDFFGEEPSHLRAIARQDVAELVASLIERMPVAWWLVLDSPAVDFARDDPEFQAVRGRFLAQLETEKARWAGLAEAAP